MAKKKIKYIYTVETLDWDSDDAHRYIAFITTKSEKAIEFFNAKVKEYQNGDSEYDGFPVELQIMRRVENVDLTNSDSDQYQLVLSSYSKRKLDALL